MNKILQNPIKTRSMSTKEQVAKKLNSLLADYEIYYQNLRSLHWNIKGEKFFQLHNLYEEYYDEAAEAIDEIAERILMINQVPLSTMADFVKHADLEECGVVSDSKKGLKIVLDNNQKLLAKFKEILEAADEAGDEGTNALMSDMIGAAEKRIWMVSSTLG